MRSVGKEIGRFLVAIIITMIIMWVFIWFGPCGMQESINIESIIKFFPKVFKCFWTISVPLLGCAFLFSLGFIFLYNKAYNLNKPIKAFFTLVSCFPVLVVGFLVLRYTPELVLRDTPELIRILIAGIILGLCDAFFIELYRHIEIEITAVKNEPYFLMAKANGLKGFKLFCYIKNDIIIHSLKVFTSKLILLISTAVVIEYIFDLNGIGYLVIEAAKYKEIELLITIECFIVGSVIFCSLVNRIVDIFLDPRLRKI